MDGDLLISEGGDVLPDLNAAALARRFRLPSTRAVYDRIRRGSIPGPSYRLGRTLYWREADVERWLHGGDEG